MSSFEPDQALMAGNYLLGELQLCQVVLMNNNKVPWFVLVPMVEDVTELYELDEASQSLLMADINCMSRFVKTHFDVSKLNVAAIGNIVRQLHVHVVGRNELDYAWPGVVWGMTERGEYTADEVRSLKAQFSHYLTA